MTHAGEVIDGRYRLVSRLGRGSMGVVWRAHDERLDRVVAVKQLVVAGTEPAEAARRAMREARVAARLRHPHAVSVFDVVSHGENPYLVMEFLPAESLSALVGRVGPLAAEVVATLGAQVAGALAAAHAAGIIHRDVTPGNVLITQDGTAKLADFGISRAAGDTTLTASGFVVGTPAYLAPEVAGGAEAGLPSDVFSLGATLYFAVEGAPPFGTDANPIALLHRIAREEITPLRHAGPLAEVLGSLLGRDPAERPAAPATAEALGRLSSRWGHAGLPSVGDVQVDVQVSPETSDVDGPASGTRVLPAGGTKVLPPQGIRPEDGGSSAASPRRTARRLAVAGVAVALVAAGVLLGVLFGDGGHSGKGGTGEVASGPVPASTGTVAPPSSSPSTPPHASCRAEYLVTNSWPGGYQAQVTVRNDGATSLTGWSVSWTVPAGDTINVWNGVLSRDGAGVTVTNADYNAVVHAGGSTSFGLTATVRGATTSAQITPICQEL